MGMQITPYEFGAGPQSAPHVADMAKMQAMVFRANLIQGMVLEHFFILSLIESMTMPQSGEFSSPFEYYAFPAAGAAKADGVFQRTFYQPETEPVTPPAEKPPETDTATPPAPKITPEASPETLAFIQKIVPEATNGDPYSFLGLTEEASAKEVKKTYRKLVLKFHPDKHKGDKQAEEAFKVIQEAYEMCIWHKTRFSR
jgi:DnaJ-like protein